MKVKIYQQSYYLNIQEYDGVATSLMVTPARQQYCDFTTSLTWFEAYSLISPKPKQESRLFAFIRPFDPMVGIYIKYIKLSIKIRLAIKPVKLSICV